MNKVATIFIAVSIGIACFCLGVTVTFRFSDIGYLLPTLFSNTLLLMAGAVMILIVENRQYPKTTPEGVEP